MKDGMNNHPQRLGGIDPAALAAATLAAVVSISIQSGPYTPLSFVVGISIGILIFAYDVDPYRTKLQSWAFASVLGLTSSLPIGYLFELATACLFEKEFCIDTFKGTSKESALNTFHISLICITTTLLVFKWERCSQSDRQKQGIATSTTSLTTSTDAGNAVKSTYKGSDKAK